MIRAKCPTCGAVLEGLTLEALPHFPFCTDRCRLLDLGRWLDGRFVVPGPLPRSDDHENEQALMDEIDADAED